MVKLTKFDTEKVADNYITLSCQLDTSHLGFLDHFRGDDSSFESLKV